MPETHDMSPQAMLNILSGIFPALAAANIGNRAGTAMGKNYLSAKDGKVQADGAKSMRQIDQQLLAQQKPGDQFSRANFTTGINPPQAQQKQVQPAVRQPQAIGRMGPEDDGGSALTSLQGAGPGSMPAHKVEAKPDLNALLDQSMFDTMQATPQAPAPLTTADDKSKMEGLLQPKPAPKYKTGSEGDVKGVSGFKRFIGYSKTGDWRDADKKEMAYQIQRAAYDRGDQSYTPQELEQLKMLQTRSEGDDKALRQHQENASQAALGAKEGLQQQRLRNRGQMDEAMARLTAQLGGDSKLAAALLERYPDAFGADQIENATGLRPDPKVLESITASRGSSKEPDPMKEILAAYLEQTLTAKNPNFKMPGKGAAPAPAPAQSAGSLNLRSLQQPR